MAERMNITPRNLAGSSYVPEADPAWVKGQELIGKQALYNNLYEDFLRRSGSPEVARANADRVMRTMERQEITGAIQGISPLLARGAEGVAGLASRFMRERPVINRGVTGEILPPLPRRNAQTPEEMLTLEAPKPVAPEAPPARDVRGTPFRDEGMVDPESIIQARVAQAERETAEQAAAMDRMLNEGGVGPTNQRIAQQAANERELTQRALEVSRLEGEGGVTADTVAAAKKAHNDRVAAEQARREAEIARFEDEGGGMAHTRVPPSYSTDFVMGETMPMTHGIPQGRPYTPGDFRRFGLPTTSTGTSLAAGATPPRSIDLLGYGAAGALGLGKQGFDYFYPMTPTSPSASMLPGGGTPAPAPVGEQNERRSPWDETNIGAPFDPMAQRGNAQRFPSLEDRIIDQVGSAKRFPSAADRAAYTASQGSGTPAPAQKQSTGADIRALWEQYNKTGNAADFVRADRAMQEARKAGIDLGLPTAQGEKRGGAVEKKPDAVHKALEIIHHLVMR